MILTPLQALAMIALTILLCGAAMILIHRHIPVRNRQIERMELTMHQLKATSEATRRRLLKLENTTKANTTTTNLNLPADDDAMALWDAIVNDARKHENPRP